MPAGRSHRAGGQMSPGSAVLVMILTAGMYASRVDANIVEMVPVLRPPSESVLVVIESSSRAGPRPLSSDAWAPPDQTVTISTPGRGRSRDSGAGEGRTK